MKYDIDFKELIDDIISEVVEDFFNKEPLEEGESQEVKDEEISLEEKNLREEIEDLEKRIKKIESLKEYYHKAICKMDENISDLIVRVSNLEEKSTIPQDEEVTSCNPEDEDDVISKILKELKNHKVQLSSLIGLLKEE